MPDLLIELFSEEVPARMQAKAADDLKKLMTDGLVEAGLTYAAAAGFATPRRLALTVEGLLDGSPTVKEERKGPRTDAPDKAIEGFLRATGLTRDQLETRDDKKGEVFFANITREGRPAADIVAEVLTATIKSFPWPKSMVWGDGDLRWVRPLHRVVCVLTDEAGPTLPKIDLPGVIADGQTEGHRFMAPKPFAVQSFDEYETALKRAYVILRADERADMIWNEATQRAFAAGLEVVEDKGLLAEVAGLVEWPVVLMGDIGEDFLGLPPEVLQTSMREHLKFFSVNYPATGRIEKYITVANRETADNGATILAGNGKVLAARLSDAKFFWENDLRIAEKDMAPWIERLSSVTFHNKLGSVSDRVARIETLASEVAGDVGADAAQAQEAARIAKADLSSEMVYEFPDLQGLMGSYYARAGGLADPVADAAAGHYAPLGPSDDVPTAPVTMAVALADKIDTLVGFWAIDEKPTGSRDPFALRRAALGVIRIVLENGLRTNLLPLFAKAGGLVKDATEGTADPDAYSDDLLSFFADRLKVYLKNDGIRHDVIDACFQTGTQDDIALLVSRIKALQVFFETPDAENLIQGYKRASNILTQEEEKDGIEYSLDPDPKFAETDDERAFFAALDTAQAKISAALEAEDFASAMSAIAALRAPIDAFFEGTLINAENPIIRRNRLCLLNRIRGIIRGVAEFSVIEA